MSSYNSKSSQNSWINPHVKNELLVMKNCKFPFIVKTHEFLENRINVFAVMEICKGGTLRSLIKRRKRISELQAK